MQSNDMQVYFRSFDHAKQFAEDSAKRFKTSINYKRNGSGGVASPPLNFNRKYSSEFKERWRRFVISVSQNKLEVTAFSATFLALTSLNAKDLGLHTSPAVIEALHITNPQTSQMSDEQLSDYLTSLSPDQLEGVINATKGKYHELKFVEQENSDFDQWHAEIISDPNHVGSDVILTNLETGDVTEIQLKATDSVGYVAEHIERYADIPVYVTSETASKLSDSVQSSGISNEDLAQEVEDSLQNASSEGVGSTIEDFVTDGVIGGGIYSAIGAGKIIRDKGTEALNDSEDRSQLIKFFVRGVAMSLGVNIFF